MAKTKVTDVPRLLRTWAAIIEQSFPATRLRYFRVGKRRYFVVMSHKKVWERGGQP